MRYDEIADRREPVEKYLAAPPGDPAALRAAREIVTLIWREHETSAADRRDQARQFLHRALTHDPHNAYLRYLHAAQKQRGD
jgi:hypothetical protein